MSNTSSDGTTAAGSNPVMPESANSTASGHASGSNTDEAGGTKRKKTSDVWEYFKVIDGANKAECQYCKQRYKVAEGGTTSTLLRHVKKCSRIKRFKAEMFNVKKAICDAYFDEDDFTREMSFAMYTKFEKYWGKVNVLMAVAAILDPRLKTLSIKFCYKRLYPEVEVDSRVNDVLEKMRAIYEIYANEHATSTPSSSGASAASGSVASGNEDNDMWRFVQSTWNESQSTSDLENYLKEDVFQHRLHTPFDILKWWQVHAGRYPILSKLARDILTIPISMVASESAFSAGGRVLDDYRSSLTKDTVEMLVCGGDWIRAGTKAELQTFQQAASVEESLEIQFPMSNLSIN